MIIYVMGEYMNTSAPNKWRIQIIVLLLSMLLPLHVVYGAGTMSTSNEISSSTRFVDVVVGDNHTCALRANGTIMCWGYNGDGQLGTNDALMRFSLYPVDVVGISDAVALSAGGNMTCAIKRDASLACWGTGYMTTSPNAETRWAPTVLAGIRDVVNVAVAPLGTCIKLTTGSVYCWGYNASSVDFWIPLPATGTNSTYYPRLYASGDVKAFAIRNISPSDYNRRFCQLRYDGRLGCGGSNQQDQLGIGSASNYNHTMYSVLGLGNQVSKFALSAQGGCAILTDQTVSCWGGTFGVPAVNYAVPEPMQNVIGSSANRHYFVGVSGKVYGVGDNLNGVLGVNSIINPWNTLTEIPELFGATRIVSPDVPPSQHGCAVLATGRIRCWGHNPWGQLGTGTQSGSYVPVNIALPGEPVVTPITTNEDTLSDLLRIRRHPEDGAETAFMRITRIVGGTLFKADGTTPVPVGSYVPVSETERGLRFMPALNLNGNNVGAVAVQASTKPNITGVSPIVVTATVSINPLADPPLISDALTDEDTQSYDGLVIVRNPADGPEVTHVVITGYSGGQLYMPNGETVIPVGSVIDMTTAGQGLRFNPDPNRTQPGTVTVKAATSARGDGASATATATVTIRPVVDGAPSVSGATTKEDELSRADIVIQRNALDGDEIRYFRVVTDLPGRLYLNDGVTMISNGGFVSAVAASAGLRFRANPNVFGTYTIQAQAATSPTVDGIGGDVARASLVITPIPDMPRISGASVDEGGMTSSGLVILPNTNDGLEITHFRIASILGGTLYLPDGITTLAVGQYVSVAQGAAGLRFAAPHASMGNGQVEVQAATAANPALTGTMRASAVVTINDKTPPMIVLPYDMILDAYYDSGTAVTFSVSASDLRDGDVQVLCDKSSGIVLPVGVNLVTCIAADQSGNSASASFTVVIQKIAPAVLLSPVDTVSGRDVSLRWSLAQPIALPYKYEVQRRALPSGEWVTVLREISNKDALIRTIGELSYAFRVRAYLSDGTQGAWSNVVNTTIDETPPQLQAFINRGLNTGSSAEATTSNRVRLALVTSSSDPVVMWRWSEDGITYGAWQAFSGRNDITLSDSDGYKEIRIEARDRVGNIATVYTGIMVNRTAGASYGVTINNGDDFTNINTVNLALTVPSITFPPIAEMQFSTTGNFDGANWEPFAFGRAWTFDDTNTSTYRIYVRFRNVEGTVTQVVQDDILVDRTAPAASLSVRTSNGQVVVSVRSNDRPNTANSSAAIVSMQIAPANEFNTKAWQPFVASTSLRISQNNAIYARFRDKAGNTSTVSCITVQSKSCTPDQAVIANNTPQIDVRTPYRLRTNGFIMLDATTIQASDVESTANQLVFTLQSEPVNGWMLFNGQRMNAGTRFSVADMQRRRIVYRQNGSANEHDRIIIQVSDGQLDSAPATVWFLLDGVADPEPTATLEPSATRTLPPTATATATTTVTRTRTASPTRTMTPSRTATRSRTPSRTATPSKVRTSTPTR